MIDQQIQEIISECKRQEVSCNYTSTALYSWRKELGWWRLAFVVLPLVFGAVASAKILLHDPQYDWLTAIAALLAGLFPAIYKALNLDIHLKTLEDTAHRFENLRDRFRQAALITAISSPSEFEENFSKLMDRMDDTRSASPAIPERHFKTAQKKIGSGDYNFNADAAKK